MFNNSSWIARRAIMMSCWFPTLQPWVLKFDDNTTSQEPLSSSPKRTRAFSIETTSRFAFWRITSAHLGNSFDCRRVRTIFITLESRSIYARSPKFFTVQNLSSHTHLTRPAVIAHVLHCSHDKSVWCHTWHYGNQILWVPFHFLILSWIMVPAPCGADSAKLGQGELPSCFFGGAKDPFETKHERVFVKGLETTTRIGDDDDDKSARKVMIDAKSD